MLQAPEGYVPATREKQSSLSITKLQSNLNQLSPWLVKMIDHPFYLPGRKKKDEHFLKEKNISSSQCLYKFYLQCPAFN